MAGGMNQPFMRAKSEFLKKYFVLPYESNLALAEAAVHGTQKDNQDEQNFERVFDFDVVKGIQGGIDAYFAGKKLDCYQIRIAGAARKTNSRTHLIKGYFLPYKNNKTYTIRLGHEADFFCTPILDGCTVAVGSGAYPKISHSNEINPHTQLIDRAAIDKQIIQRHGALVDARINKEGYTNVFKKRHSLTNFKCFVVGFRENNRWSFYYQVSELFYARDVITGREAFRYNVLARCERLR